MAFTAHFCDRCKRGHGSCRIVLATLVNDAGEPGYPKEWVMDNDCKNPRCTAFQLCSNLLKRERDRDEELSRLVNAEREHRAICEGQK